MSEAGFNAWLSELILQKIEGSEATLYIKTEFQKKIILENFKEFQRIGIGDAIKIEYGKQRGLTFEEIEANKHLYRADLIELGNWGRAQSGDYWLNNLANMNNIIVPDVRVEYELEFFKAKGAFLVTKSLTKS